MMLHNFVIENDGLQLNNLESDVRNQFGVEPLPPQRSLVDADNNGYVPTAQDEDDADELLALQPSDQRRNTILQSIISLDLRRPFDNIARNGG